MAIILKNGMKCKTTKNKQKQQQSGYSLEPHLPDTLRLRHLHAVEASCMHLVGGKQHFKLVTFLSLVFV